jgi:hypothetical protein
MKISTNKGIKEMNTNLFYHIRIPNLSSFVEYKVGTTPIERAGIYALIKEGNVVYIGKTTEIERRLVIHKREKGFNSYLFYPTKKAFNRCVIEQFLILRYKPILNVGVDRGFK